jgi:SAM-dependent MidA family methyltransferase
MSAALQRIIDERIAAKGGITVAEYMELALYHPQHGYYASRAQRSGRAGDFYTSVDAGPLFGACIAQFLNSRLHQITNSPTAFDLVEVAAGNGRLSRDILDAAEREYPNVYSAVHLHLVERSPEARAAQRETLGPHARKLASSGGELPPRIDGAIVANELLDAMPCHLVEMSDEGLRELYVTRDHVLESAPLSDERIAVQLTRAGARLEPGWRAEVSLAAAAWVTAAARALASGTLLLFDYGHRADALYDARHSAGTLVRYAGHRVDDRWLESPGDCDLTAHVDFTTVQLAAEAEGLRLAAFMDQTRFLVENGIANRLPTGSSVAEVRARLQARTLISPEGLGGTIKVMALERPAR